MNANTYQIRLQAKAALLAHFRENSPEFKRCFFSNRSSLRDLFLCFAEEVADNCASLSGSTKREYLNSIDLCFGLLTFSYDPVFLDSLFRQYGEDITCFPRIENPELHAILSTDLKKKWKANPSERLIVQMAEYKKVQEQCLNLFYHLKLQKVREYLKKVASLEEVSCESLKEEKEFRELLVPTRTGQKNFLQFLKKDLMYLDGNSSGLKSESQLTYEKAEIIKRTAQLAEEAVNEIDDNLMKSPEEKEIKNLKLFSRELERRQVEHQKYDFDLLNYQDPAFGQPGLELQLQDRPDISQALQQVNAERLVGIAKLLEKIALRIEDFQEIKGEKKDRNKNEITALDAVALLEENEFFTGPRLKGKDKQDIAKVVKRLTGHSEQNLRKWIGQLEKSKPSNHVLEAQQKACEFYDEVVG